MTLLVGSIGLVNQWSSRGTISAQALVDGAFYQFTVAAINSIGSGP